MLECQATFLSFGVQAVILGLQWIAFREIKTLSINMYHISNIVATQNFSLVSGHFVQHGRVG